MKDLKEFINESLGNSFKNKVKYTSKDYESWKTTMKKEKVEFNTEGDFEYIYLSQPKPKHIGTYNKKKQELHCDDINLFGHEVK